MRRSISLLLRVAAMWVAGVSTVGVSNAVADPRPATAKSDSANPSLTPTSPEGGQGQVNNATQSDDVRQIRDLLLRNDLAGAEKLYAAALERDASDSELRALAYRLFVAQARARQPSQALDYLLGYLDYQVDWIADEPETASRLPGYWNSSLSSTSWIIGLG